MTGFNMNSSDHCLEEVCMPDEGKCITIKFTDSQNTTKYWRGCEIEGLSALPDGCSDGCLNNGQHYCKKTCNSKNCNDDELMENTGKVTLDKLILIIAKMYTDLMKSFSESVH